MKYVDEYRDRATAEHYAAGIRRIVTKPWNIMEVCGGQTHTIVKSGLDELLPHEVSLIHGPGCPVCVTPLEIIDKAIAIASQPGVIFTSFGDMLRVPGSTKDLLTVKSEGSDVRIVYSPLNAVTIAKDHPHRQVVFFAVGFETTAPANAMAVQLAKKAGLRNFSILCSHVLVPPAIRFILSSEENRIDGFLAAGHVCAVTGYEEYEPIAEEFDVPIVVTGFEPVDILQGLFMVLRQLEEGTSEVGNQYARVVKREGNGAARALLASTFEIADRPWRGIGIIPRSGYVLKDEFSAYDAEKVFDVSAISAVESPLCMAGLVLQGLKKPDACPAFGRECIPEHPLGAPMVSSEGACAAYYRFKQ